MPHYVCNRLNSLKRIWHEMSLRKNKPIQKIAQLSPSVAKNQTTEFQTPLTKESKLLHQKRFVTPSTLRISCITRTSFENRIK